jgi:hypothetical protein
MRDGTAAAVIQPSGARDCVVVSIDARRAAPLSNCDLHLHLHWHCSGQL